MATINPSNLYSGGQVNLDSTPFVKFALQQEAQKKAKDEALDKFFAEKNAKLTSTGMRESEIAPLAQVKNQLQDYWLKNRNNIHNISKDNGKAWGEYNKLFNTAQSIIDNSKAAANITNEAGKLKATHPELVDRMDENTLMGLDQHSQPIYMVGADGKIAENPKFKPFDFNSINYNPELYTPKQLQDQLEEEIKFTPRDVNKEDIQKTNDPYTNKVSTISSYNADKIKQIADRRATAFDTDKRLSFTFDKGHDLLKTPFSQWKQSHVDNYNKLNADFKNLYGKDIETPKELYKAEVISSIKDPITTKEELRTNEAKKQSDRVANAYLNDYLIKRRGGGAGTDAVSELNDVYGGINNQVETDNTKGNTGTRINALSLDGQDYIVGLAKKLTGNNGIGNADLFLSKDKNGIAIYKVDDNGSLYRLPKNLVGYLPPIGTNIKVQPNAKAKVAAVSQGNKIINANKKGKYD